MAKNIPSKRTTSKSVATKTPGIIKERGAGKASKSAAGNAFSKKDEKSLNKTSGTGPRRKE